MKTQIEKSQQQRIYIFSIFTNILLKHSQFIQIAYENVKDIKK